MTRPSYADPISGRAFFARAKNDHLVVPAETVCTPFGPVVVTLYALSSSAYFAAPVPPWYDLDAERLASRRDDVPVLRRPGIAQGKPAELYRLSDVCGVVRWLPWGG